MTALGTVLLGVISHVAAAADAPVPPAVSSHRWPVFYEKNQGQFHRDIEYVARGPNMRITLGKTALSVTLPGRETIRIEWEGSVRSVPLNGEWATGGISHYLRQANGRTATISAEHYGRVRYTSLYPGIDLVFYAKAGLPEFDFVISPHADPTLIRMRIRPNIRVALEENGQLALTQHNSTVRLGAPVFYQQCSDGVCPVRGRYRLFGGRRDLVGFEIAPYSRESPLVVDPSLSATYLGGSNGDIISAVTTDGLGNIYATGYTASQDFPVLTQGSYKGILGTGQADAFVVKMNSSMTSVLYATFMGGTFDDYGRAIAVDASGAAYVTGSTVGRYPVTPGAYRPRPSSAPTIFITKLSSDGSTLVYSTYLDGAGSGQAIAVNSSGEAHVAGWTYTPTFTTTPGPFQKHRGGNDAFVVKLNHTGTDAIYSMLLGGKGDDQARGIHLIPTGGVVVVGTTTSSDLSTTPGAYQPQLSGKTDAFVTGLSATGAQVYSTYLGGSLDDRASAVSVDNGANVFVAGDTESADFPVKNAYQSERRGSSDAFVAKLASNGASLTYATLLGGPGSCNIDDTFRTYTCDAAFGISVDASGRAWVTGVAGSSFPTTGSPQLSFGGGGDAFLAQLSESGSQLVYSTYLGGSLGEVGLSVATAVANVVVVGGLTTSSDVGITTGGIQSAAGGGDVDGLLVRYGECPAVFLSTGSNFPASGGTYSGPAISAPTSCSWSVSSGSPWVTVSNANGSGNGEVGMTIAANTQCARTATLSLSSGATYTITQSHNDCAQFPSSESWFPASGGTFTMTIWTYTPSTTWSVASTNPFTTVPDGLNRTGPGTISVVIAPNTTGAYRTGYLWLYPFNLFFNIHQPRS